MTGVPFTLNHPLTMPKKAAKKRTAKKPQSEPTADSPQPAAPTPKPLEVVERPADMQGVEDLVFVRTSSLTDNPQNWRKHPERQKKAVRSSVSENGWAGAALYNKTTGHLIDGHCRKEGFDVIPVLVGSFTPEQERRILMTLDPISAMAEMDTEMFKNLEQIINDDLEALGGIDNAEFNQSFDDITDTLNTFSEAVTDGRTAASFLTDSPRILAGDSSNWALPESLPDPVADSKVSFNETEDLFELNDDIIFPSDHPLGIPPLRTDKLATTYPTNTWAGPGDPHGAQPDMYYDHPQRPYKDKPPGGYLGFYCFDEEFENVYNDPAGFIAKIKPEQWTALLTPAYSMYWDWPVARNLFNCYRTRWLLRWFQEMGYDVIPHVLWTNRDLEFDYYVKTLPVGTPVIATECRGINEGGGKETKAQRWQHYRAKLAESIDHLKPDVVLIYGGIDNRKEIEGKLPSGPKYVLLESQMRKRQRLRKDGTYKR